MAENTVNSNSESEQNTRIIEQQLAAQTAKQLKEEFDKLDTKKQEVAREVERAIQGNRAANITGEKNDKDSLRGSADSVKNVIQKILYAGKKAPEKIPTPEPKAPGAAGPAPEKTTELVQKLSEKIILDDVTDQNAPYVYDLLKNIMEGNVKTAEDLAREVRKIEAPLRYVSPGMLNKVQQASVDYAVNNNIAEKEAKAMFGVEDRQMTAEDQMRAQAEALDEKNFEGQWQQYFSSYFNNEEDYKLIETLYSPRKFIDYYKNVQTEVARDFHLTGKEEIAQKASTEMEVKISLLFAKLYAKLDHESPKEYFQTIEQEDIMRGITPVKSELKRRIQRLAGDLHHYQHELEKDGEKIIFYRRLEEDTETAAIDVGNGKVKPRARLVTKLKAEESDGGEFAHYLEQIVDHYIEARRYTHNSRAILLHPADASKGFYSQLAQFAAESSSLDFDQMMLLPDNDIFQSAFGLYNKMIEEQFAKFDWRHHATMFTTKENEHLTETEKHIMDQLRAMYADRHISDDRLSAALTMAVGASRGMFLTEEEMAAHADPHLDEKGGATFTSYYNQDATPLMAFNTQHLLARFAGGPNMLDPIFFLPIDHLDGSQAFKDHKELWDKAGKYKKSFLEGRKALPEKTFFDMLDNIGLVGGPMQRKGWRTSWELQNLYVNDKVPMKNTKGETIQADKVNFVKTFKYFENIGYELMQDYVTKLDFMDKGFASSRDTPLAKEPEKRLHAQKMELFRYVYEKYFDENPEGLSKYLDSIRAEKKSNLLKAINKGEASPENIDATVEGQVTRTFLDQMLARVITQRLPSKILRMDRDRYSKDGSGMGRWKKVMVDMGLDGQFDKFDDIMQDMILAEQMLRKEVSAQMREMRDKDRPHEEYGSINYRMSPDTIRRLLGPLVAKGHMTEERINDVLKLYGHIETHYLKNKTFIDKELVPFFKNGGASDRESKYTIALDETDLSFIPFRGGGQSVLARSIRDIAAVEENVSKPITEFVKKLRMMAIDGKKDFSPIIESIQKVYGALDGIIGTSYAIEVSSKLSSLAIMYMKRDTESRAMMGVLGIGRYNSMAAESAGKKVGVWEWDSADIDRWITALEARGLVPGTPYNIATEPSYDPVYLKLPFAKESIRMPEKIPLKSIAEWFGIKNGEIKIGNIVIPISDIPLFRQRHKDFPAWSKQLREKYGGRKFDMMFEIFNKYLPIALALILFKLIKDAFDASEGKKK